MYTYFKLRLFTTHTPIHIKTSIAFCNNTEIEGNKNEIILMLSNIFVTQM
ncbi:hypothetical protein BCAH1134_C0542 (plasmid) [Bacillus cereus AH1134]|nr:hypothetical protein BCAH1134_C0542 [Bacillus cereus AH1134]